MNPLYFYFLKKDVNMSVCLALAEMGDTVGAEIRRLESTTVLSLLAMISTKCEMFTVVKAKCFKLQEA